MIQPRYLTCLVLATMGFFALYLVFTLTVDPYGVSPIKAVWDPLNKVKPKRRNLDRQIKPYEVWRFQPRTVFMGSSRILESMDPAVLDGSRFAPAYNASVPANALSLDAAQLAQYIELDPNLKVVFVELFFWNFIYRQPDAPRLSLSDFIGNTWPLYVSEQTLWDSIITVGANALGKQGTPNIGPRGNWQTRPDANARLQFEAYVASIMKTHKGIPKLELQPTAFRALDRIVEVCRQNGLELYFLITPNHPYDDYRIRSFGYWHLLEQWHRRLAAYPRVLAASQYTGPLIEPVSEKMLYWNDPIHPSSNFGALVLRAFLGQRAPDIPPDILLPLSPDVVDSILEKRTSGLETWISANASFAMRFEREKVAAGFNP